MTETCHGCKKKLPRDEAIEAGWEPSFWDVQKDEEVFEPVCADCQPAFAWNEAYQMYETIPPAVIVEG